MKNQSRVALISKASQPAFCRHHYKAFCFLLLLFFSVSYRPAAQVKIGNNPGTINPNSLLELESTNKGFLPPRVALNSFNAIAPLTGTVPSGMLVFSSGGLLADGYYYWNGSAWKPLTPGAPGGSVTKTVSATLTKAETLVFASNNITLTLPAITPADNGLAITVKHIGSHANLVQVTGSGSATIDGAPSSKLFRWLAKTFIAHEGVWMLRNKETSAEQVYQVSQHGSWTSIKEVMEFLNLHMSGPSVVLLSGGVYPLSATQTIDLPYPLTIQGVSYGKVIITPAAGIEGKPMFICESETYFKMLVFDGSALPGYGNTPGADGVRMTGVDTYYEVKDAWFKNFNRGIVLSNNVEAWIFEIDVSNCVAAGIEVAAGTASGAFLKVSATDFYNNATGIHLLSGRNAKISVANSYFYNDLASNTGIKYIPATFTTFGSMFISSNGWNNIGKFVDGFDFTRTDGRDANAFVQNNVGYGDKNPSCKINVVDNTLKTTITNANSLYKVAWTNTSAITTKWTVSGNRITYQSANKRDGWAVITGNISVPSNNRTITISIIKNGVLANPIGESALRLTAANEPYQFSTVIYLTDIGPGDYFELHCSSNSSGDLITFHDVHWFTETK
jgi:hypothetical protein